MQSATIGQTLESVHQVRIAAGWTEAVWNINMDVDIIPLITRVLCFLICDSPWGVIIRLSLMESKGLKPL